MNSIKTNTWTEHPSRFRMSASTCPLGTAVVYGADAPAAVDGRTGLTTGAFAGTPAWRSST